MNIYGWNPDFFFFFPFLMSHRFVAFSSEGCPDIYHPLEGSHGWKTSAWWGVDWFHLAYPLLGFCSAFSTMPLVSSSKLWALLFCWGRPPSFLFSFYNGEPLFDGELPLPTCFFKEMTHLLWQSCYTANSPSFSHYLLWLLCDWLPWVPDSVCPSIDTGTLLWVPLL